MNMKSLMNANMMGTPGVVINKPQAPRDGEHLLLMPFWDDDPKCDIFIG